MIVEYLPGKQPGSKLYCQCDFWGMLVEYLYETHPCSLAIPESSLTGPFICPGAGQSGRQYLLRNLEIKIIIGNLFSQ